MANFILTSKKIENKDEGILVVDLDGKKCDTIAKFYKVMETGLRFPDYFGNNLDSFDEMINDLTWLEEDAVMIQLTNFDELLEEEALETKELLLSLLDEAADSQQNDTEGTPIKIIIVKSDDTEDFLDELGIDYV
jgi:RNAse (barnase) inhibitor barstar